MSADGGRSKWMMSVFRSGGKGEKVGELRITEL